MTIATSATELAGLPETVAREATGRPPEPRAFADFHIHTRYSRDSRLGEVDFIARAIERGLTHVAITNHNNVEGAVAMRDKVAEMGLSDRLSVILGEEVSTADGEVVGLFLTETIPRGLSADETADEIHRQGGPCLDPPPFRPVPQVAHPRGAAAPRWPRRARSTWSRSSTAGSRSSATTRRPPSSRRASTFRESPRPTRTRAWRLPWPPTSCLPFSTADELRSALSDATFHASRSSVLIHLTTRWAVLMNRFDAWRGRPRPGSPQP